MKQRRALFTILLAVLLLIGIPCLMIYQETVRLERNRALIRAIRRTDEVAVRSLLRQGADPNARELPEPSGTFSEHLLVLWNHLRHGPPKPPPDAPSALMLAVDSNITPIVTDLLNAGAKGVDAKIDRIEWDTHELSPLLVVAAKRGNVDVLQALLAHGANLETVDYLDLAQTNDYRHIATILQRAGAKAKRQSEKTIRQK
jgi:ankyrin repeat protein